MKTSETLAELAREVVEESGRLESENRRLTGELETAKNTIANLRRVVDNLRSDQSKPFMEK